MQRGQVMPTWLPAVLEIAVRVFRTAWLMFDSWDEAERYVRANFGAETIEAMRRAEVKPWSDVEKDLLDKVEP